MIPYFYPIDIPSTGTVGYYKEFTHSHHKTLVKAILQDDNDILDQVVNNIIESVTYKGPNVSTLNIFDKAYIMSAIRAYNISPTITFVAKTVEGTKANIEVDINTIVVALEATGISHYFTLKSSNGMEIYGSLPKYFYYSNVLDIVTGCISKIVFNNKCIDLTCLDKSEQKNIVHSLPSTVFMEVFNFLKSQDQKLSKNPVYTMSDDVEVEGPSEIRLSLFNSILLEYIKLLYNANLQDFYLNEYSLANKFKMPIEIINSSTPAEIGLYYTIIADDLKKQQKEMDKQQKQGDMQLPGPGPGTGMGLG